MSQQGYGLCTRRSRVTDLVAVAIEHLVDGNRLALACGQGGSASGQMGAEKREIDPQNVKFFAPWS